MAVRNANIMAARGLLYASVLKFYCLTGYSCCGCNSNLTRPSRHGQDDTVRKRRDHDHK